jgi:ricin-type beta-trefoil lectin protein
VDLHRQRQPEVDDTMRRVLPVIGGIVGAVAVTAAVLVVLPGGTAGAAGAGQITGIGGKCLDVAAANTANGTAVQLWTCNGTAAQNWTVGDDGTIRALGKCLDVAAAGTADGTKLQLWDCNGTGAQAFRVEAARDIVNVPANRCLDATGQSSADGTRIQIWTCTGAANQKWTAPTGGGGTTPPPPPTGAMAAAPYLYEGWGNPPNPQTVMQATGVRWFTLAFMLSNGSCNPQWDGQRPLTGGVDQSTINAIRAAGGNVIPSFGGASGNKLEASCTSASALAGAYQKVINAYGLAAIDIDIETDAYSNPTIQQRTVDALKIVRQSNPGLVIYMTFPSDQNGPDASLINRAAAGGLTVDGWTIMPFDFGGTGNMGQLSTQAAEGLKNRLKAAYGYSDDLAYRHSGISSMNGVTDSDPSHVTTADFNTMLAYAQAHHLARFTFWSVNRDRPCTGGDADSCSGVSQSNWDYTRIVARYTG